jgi:hypothetical protein
LCDLLIVFGKDVLIFSDKHCEFPENIDLKIAWPRWYRRAIEKSARQLVGAEKFVKAFPNRIFLDKNCEAPFPIELPEPNVARYFLIAVTRGSYDAATHYWGGGSSGSLMLNNTLVGEAHYGNPFRVGFPLQNKRFVHVLDEMTVDILLEELDTVPDLVAYLECKERFLSQNLNITVAGDEQLLARYMCTLRDKKHALPVIPDGTTAVALIEGDWEFYSNSPQRVAKKEADAGSYAWDQLIEHQSSFIRAGTALSFSSSDEAFDHETIVRVLADESRLSRRELAMHFRHALSQSESGKKFARIIISGDRPNRAYVFLTIPRPTHSSYEEYREVRRGILLAYCSGIKLKMPNIVEAVGIASEPMTDSTSSQDFLHVDLSAVSVDSDEAAGLNEAMAELEIMQPQTMKYKTWKSNEYPVPFDFSNRPTFNSAFDGAPMNRKARRSMAKRARKRPRRT